MQVNTTTQYLTEQLSNSDMSFFTFTCSKEEPVSGKGFTEWIGCRHSTHITTLKDQTLT